MPTLTIPYAETPLKQKGDTVPRGRLGPRVVFYTILFSSVITFLATALQLYLDFARDKQAIDTRLAQIEQSYLHSIGLSLWSMDYDQIRTQLEGIAALPDIEYLEINANGTARIFVGADQGRGRITRSFPLTHPYRGSEIDLGTLRVVASLDNVYQRLFDRVLVIFGSQAVKTFLVATFMLLLFQWLVVRHLAHLSSFLRDKRLDDTSGWLSLKRSRRDEVPDELDDVVNAFNDMCSVLQESYDRLAQSEERFNLAMEGANDGLWDWDLERDEVYYSPRWKDMLGYGENELSGDPEEWRGRLHPEERERVLADLEAHLDGRRAFFDSTHRLRHRDGSYRWILSRGRALRDDAGRPRRMVGTHVDVTEQKETEAQLAEATERLRAEQEKRVQAERLACVGEISASIAHEIRNPLSSIVNSSALLTSDGISEEDRRGVAEIVNDETQRLQRILEEFLNFARLKPSEPVPGDLVAALEETVESFAMSADGGVDGIEVCTDFHAAAAPAVFDADQIRQVAWNLLSNAVQAMPEGGEVTVATRVEGDGVRVSVWDTGSGIPSHMQERVTRPFVTGRENGTGLGLSIVQRILAQHGAELQVLSETGRGTEMTFRIRQA